MNQKIVKNVVQRFREKTAMAVVLRSVVKHDWGWFSREDPRMHLQTVEQGAREGRAKAKVWLETRGERDFEWAEGTISGQDRKKLLLEIEANRANIESRWVAFMISNQWLKADLSGSIVILTAYPGDHNTFVRKIDLKRLFPGSYAKNVQPNWAERTIQVSLDDTTATLAVGPEARADDRNHLDLGPILWG